jgi:CDP-diacylglycerol--glycerol-3-phosphate 3-phosphatidyltransferase
MSLYQFKSQFQSLLRPLVVWLHGVGVTANQVTVLACLISVVLGSVLYLSRGLDPHWFALIPLWMLLRMGMNAMDGMLAREHGQQSTLGAYLNELTDVISDAALYLPFATVLPLQPLGVGVLVLLAALSEMAGLQGLTVGAGRRYDGPLGKSDRALVFGALGLAVALWGALPAWTAWVMPALIVLTALTVGNRVMQGVAQSGAQ